jgi:hypothetical protein
VAKPSKRFPMAGRPRAILRYHSTDSADAERRTELGARRVSY